MRFCIFCLHSQVCRKRSPKYRALSAKELYNHVMRICILFLHAQVCASENKSHRRMIACVFVSEGRRYRYAWQIGISGVFVSSPLTVCHAYLYLLPCFFCIQMQVKKQDKCEWKKKEEDTNTHDKMIKNADTNTHVYVHIFTLDLYLYLLILFLLSHLSCSFTCIRILFLHSHILRMCIFFLDYLSCVCVSSSLFLHSHACLVPSLAHHAYVYLHIFDVRAKEQDKGTRQRSKARMWVTKEQDSHIMRMCIFTSSHLLPSLAFTCPYLLPSLAFTSSSFFLHSHLHPLPSSFTRMCIFLLHSHIMRICIVFLYSQVSAKICIALSAKEPQNIRLFPQKSHIIISCECVSLFPHAQICAPQKSPRIYSSFRNRAL